MKQGVEGPGNRKRLGEMLLDEGWVTHEDLEAAMEIQKGEGGRLGRILVDRDLVAEGTLLDVLSRQLGLPVLDLSRAGTDPDAVSLISYSVAKRYRALPLEKRDRVLHVAMVEPQDTEAVQALEFASGMRIRAGLCSSREIDIAVEQCYGMGEAVERIVRNVTREACLDDASASIVLEEDGRREGGSAPEGRESVETGAPIVRLVNLILLEAVRREASDIHFEPARLGLQVRFRLDGALRKRMSIPGYLQSSVLSRVKIMARMDITNRRTPQDGGIRLQVEGRRMDLRVSCLPAFFGEKIVIRLLDQTERGTDLVQLGMNPEERRLLEERYRQPQGMILVTGPTGSGKSTTLQCILKDLRGEGTNIITVEDPVEYELEGVNQVQIHTEAGLSFAGTLRAILRQDPNVIMVGEILDPETAEVAFRAALTGHLVLSTLHTNDTVSTITRLEDMGVPRFLIASSMLAVLSQRLARKICGECREPFSPGPEEMRSLKRVGQEPPEKLFRGSGCSRCDYTGYRGRVGIFELLTVSVGVRDRIADGSPEGPIREAAVGQGMRLILQDGVDKVLQGVTSLEELLSVVPWEAADAREGGVPVPDATPACRMQAPGSRRVIVLAEDDPGLREVVALTLETLSCDVHPTADVQEAWETVQRCLPDLIVTDINMPLMDGFTLLKRVRSDLRTAFIPVIFLTSKNRCEDRVKGYLLGGDDYIEKPFDHRELLVRARRCMNRGAMPVPERKR
jgi:type IV pilus assembly protein PilB